MRRHAFPRGGCVWTQSNFTASPHPTCPRWSWRLEAGSMPERRRRARCARSASSRPRRSPRSTQRSSSTLPTIRPVVRLSAEGSARSAGRGSRWTWQPPDGGAGLLFRGVEPQQRWRTYATLLLDVAARCGVQRLVSLGAVLAAVPHTRPPQVTGSSTDPVWQARFEACGIRTRRSRYEGPTGIATVVMDAARRRGMASCTRGASAPLPRERHQSGRESRAADSRSRTCSTWSWMWPLLRRPCGPFGPNVTRRGPGRRRPRPMSGN